MMKILAPIPIPVFAPGLRLDDVDAPKPAVSDAEGIVVVCVVGDGRTTLLVEVVVANKTLRGVG